MSNLQKRLLRFRKRFSGSNQLTDIKEEVQRIPDTVVSLSRQSSAKQSRREGSARRKESYGLDYAKLRHLQQQWNEVRDLELCQQTLCYVFSTYHDILLAFKKTADSRHSSAHGSRSKFKLCSTTSGVDIDFTLLGDTYDFIQEMPAQLQRSLLHSLNKCLNSLPRGVACKYNRDHLRVYMIVLLNPVLHHVKNYPTLASLLSQISSLPDPAHRIIVGWLQIVPLSVFKEITGSLMQFISLALYPSRPETLPPACKRKWWIPSAVKTLALFNAANEGGYRVPASEMYNNTLDGIDIIQQYILWLDNHDSEFSFCQYPFIISLQNKNRILHFECQRQMKKVAKVRYPKRCLVQRMQQHQLISSENLFLSITVRRDHLVEDSIFELENNREDLNKKIRVHFMNEPAIDLGGLTKEWFLLVARAVFDVKYGLFKLDPLTNLFWFNPCCSGIEFSEEYKLVGILMGLAVYNNIILDINLPLVAYTKLLTPALPPEGLELCQGEVGEVPVTSAVMQDTLPDVWSGLTDLLHYTGDVEQDFGMYFEVLIECFGDLQSFELKPGGALIPVTNRNKVEYIDLLCNFYINTAISRQFRAFYTGFHSVCSSNAMMLITGCELEEMICGVSSVDMRLLQRYTSYDGFRGTDKTISLFWELVHTMSDKEQRQLLMFWTGSSRVPLEGTLNLTIARSVLKNRLPEAHTCFNQLVIPVEEDREKLLKSLRLALDNSEGFGLE